MNLTPNFTLEELTVSETAERNGWDNSPNDSELANLTRLADMLEQVKVVLGGKPIMISSGFRCKQVNDSVGSKDTSQHRIGCAADFRVPGMTPDQVIKEVSQAGQITTMVAEVARAKAIAQVLGQVKIVDKSGKKVDIQALAPKKDPESKSE